MNIEFVRKINETKRRAYEYVEENKLILQQSMVKKTLLFYLEDTLRITKEYKDLGNYEDFTRFVDGIIDYKDIDEDLDKPSFSIYEQLLLLARKIKNNVISSYIIKKSKEEDILFMS